MLFLCIFEAKLLYHYCKVSAQYGLSAIVVQQDLSCMHLPLDSAFYSVTPYISLPLKQWCWVLSCQSSGSGTAVVSTFPSPLREGLHIVSSAEGSLSWSRSIPTTNPACGRCMKPETVLTYGSLCVTGSQSLTWGTLCVSCPSCCQQIPLTLLSSCSIFFLMLQQPVLSFLLRPWHVPVAEARVTGAANKNF